MDSRTSLAIGTGTWFGGTLYAVATDDRIVTAVAIVGGIVLGAVAIWQRVQDGRDNDLRKRLTEAWQEVREKDAEIDALRRDKDTQIDALRDIVRRSRDEVHHFRNVANRLSLELRNLGRDPGDIQYVAYDQEVVRDRRARPDDDARVGDADLPGVAHPPAGKPGD
jgi:predicted RNase H-related nuclease YkuK (DUF458 family)